MPDGLLPTLANRANQAILALLAVEPAYPRRIADLVGIPETEVARRLRAMEGLGLVEGAWANIGKNVKMYRLLADAVSLRITSAGLRAELAGPGGVRVREDPLAVQPFAQAAPEPALFVGREEELAALDGPDPVVALEGMPGIGKSALLARFVQAQGGRRAVFWHGFRGVETMGWLAHRAAPFLAAAGKPDLARAAAERAEVADLRELLLRDMDDPGLAWVFDDHHLAADEAVRLFLADAAARVRQAKLVVAGRERLRFDPAQGRVRLLRLGGLGDEATLRFALDRGLAIDPALLPRVREEVGGHPLALALLVEGALQRGGALGELLDRVPEHDLEEWLLREIHAGLAEDEKGVLAHASLFRAGFTLEDLGVVWKQNPESALLRLRRRSLVEARDGTYALHEVLRNFFYPLLKNRAELHERLAAHFLDRGTLEDRIEAMHHHLAAGRRDRVLALLERNLDLREFDFVGSGYQALYLHVLELFPREQVKDPRRWALIEDEKGDLRFHRGEHEAALAHYDAALQPFAALRDAARVGDLAWKRALTLQRLRRREEAIAACEQGLREAPGDGPERRRLETLRAELRKG